MADLRWWQRAVFYQIYPRSFADGNDDGIGDFQGMIEHLDYLKDLGIDAIWLSPHYPSPLFDCGYDISDYTAVAPEYGTLDDFQRFLDGAHERGLRVVLDMVLNHTSDQHPWFLESRSSRDNPKRDWYVWLDGKNGEPPNNWVSTFGGSAWEHDSVTDQYYYHFFLRQQPDLNWRNPEVKQAMFNAVRFWLDRGVDGFRLDAIATIYEDPALPANEHELAEADLIRAIGSQTGGRGNTDMLAKRDAMLTHQLDQPGLHELMRDLRKLVYEYPDRVLIGETEDLSYCGSGDDELDLVFNFPLMRTDRLTPAWVRQNQQVRLAACLPGVWPCNTLNNHDNSRLISHYTEGDHAAEWGRLGLALMLTLRGTPFLYNGEEIGMTDLRLHSVEQFRDLLGVWYYHALVDCLRLSPEAALAEASELTRDKCRTPMQWTGGHSAGFSLDGAKPWLPIHPAHASGVNVADESPDPNSLLNFYKRMLRLRRETPALVEGEYEALGQVDPKDECLAFVRRTEGQTCLIVLSMGDSAQRLDLRAGVRNALRCAQPSVDPALRLLFSSHERAAECDNLTDLAIAPFEIYIAEV